MPAGRGDFERALGALLALDGGEVERRAHALLGFGHRLVGQADDVEGGQAGRDLYLHVDGAGLDALEGNRADALDHGSCLTCYLRVYGSEAGCTRTFRERTRVRH